MTRLRRVRWFTIGLCVVALSACGSDKKSSDMDGEPGGNSSGDGGSGGNGANGSGSDGSGGSNAGSSDGGANADGGGPNTQIPLWFESKDALELKLSGNLGDAFRAAFAGTPDGIVPPDRVTDPFAGSLAYEFPDGTPHTATVELEVRGSSSLQECAFPKLKLNFESRVKDEADTFYDTSKLKIGTHCGEEDSTNGNIGRLRNEKAAFREEVVYQLARATGITIMQTRPAVIEYSDTSTEAGFESPLTRKAFLLEHVDELARRLDAKAAKDPSTCGDNPDARPDHQSVLRIKMFHAMVGNWDWELGPAAMDGCGASLHNTEVLTNKDGSLTLVPADFDLAALVVGEVRGPDNSQLVAITLDSAKAAARTALAGAVDGETKQAVDAMKTELLGKKAALSKVINDSLMDADGKQNGQLLLDGFFAVLEE